MCGCMYGGLGVGGWGLFAVCAKSYGEDILCFALLSFYSLSMDGTRCSGSSWLKCAI